MKKIITGLLVSVFLLSISTCAFADNIGFIDMDRLLMSYKGAKTVQEELQKKREEYQKVFEEKQKKIEEAKKADKADKEIQELIAKMEEELRPQQEMLLRNESEEQRKLLNKIINIGKQVKKEYGIDVILDKRVVLDGGFDLTDFILDKLNK
jgi:outer membrane protein